METIVMPKILVTQKVAMTTSSATSSQLTKGTRYQLKSKSAFWYRQGASGVVAAADTANNVYVAAGETWEFTVDDVTNEGYIAAIVESGSASLFIHRVDGAM